MLMQGNKEMLDDAEFQRISDVVYRHCGINLHDGKKELVRARIAKQLRTGGFDGASAYVDHVLADTDGDAFHDFIDSLSTNLTSFFREVGHFHHLADVFLPALLAKRRKAHSGRVRAWSAGCSTGEEPYSLAMVLRESLPDLARRDVRLLATDISSRVLAPARAARYADAAVADVPPELLRRHFLRAGDAWEVVPAVRSLVTFARLNLMAEWPMRGPFEAIFCRNVMIYFDKPTQQELVARFHELLAPGGHLFVGHAESLSGIAHGYSYVQPAVYRK